jgi:hypothetical protein
VRKIVRVPSVLVLSGMWGCGSPPPPLPAPPAYEFPHATVWTAFPGIHLVGDSLAVEIQRPFTALHVIDASREFLTVRCANCEGAPVGRVRQRDVVFETRSPAEAAHASLAEFALAVRAAAERADTVALAAVMAPDFTFALTGAQGAERARAAWAAGGFRTLSEVPALLDRGLAPVGRGVWAAPPAFAEALGYHGLRTGFRRSAGGRWEWLFLVRGEVDAASGPAARATPQSS